MQSTMLNWVDYAIIAILILSVIISIVRGFIREALSLVTWIAAFWLAFRFAPGFAEILAKYISTPSLRTPAAFAILFISTLIVGSIVNYCISLLVDKTGLSGTDRMLGIVFGAARGLLLVAALLLAANLTPLPHDPWWKTSRLIPHFQPIEAWIKALLPESVSKQFELSKTVNDAKSLLPVTPSIAVAES
jgi:membrane protein required for colicin V production